MKQSVKKKLASLLLPILLVTGLLSCIVFYQVRVIKQMGSIMHAEIETWTVNESRLFALRAEGRLNALNALAVAINNYDGSNTEISDELCRHLGFTGIAIADAEGIRYISGMRQEKYEECLLSGASKTEGTTWLCQAKTPNERSLICTSVPLMMNSGESAALIGYTVSGVMNSELRASAASENTDRVVFTPDGTIMAHFGKDHEFIEGQNIYTYLFGAEDAQKFQQQLDSGEVNGSFIYHFGDKTEYASYTTLGQSQWRLMSIVDTALINEKLSAHLITSGTASVFTLILSSALFVIIILRTRRRRLDIENQQQNSMRALMIDELTGSYTAQGFDLAATAAIEKLPEDKICAMVAFEIMSFRSFNALYGFEKGDELLKDIAAVSMKNSNPNEVLGHLFADRFVWMMYDDSLDALKARMTRGYYEIRERQMPFFLCAGIYEITDRAVDISTMVDKASLAKESVKSNYTAPFAIFSDDMLEAQLEDAELINDMSDALSNGEFVDFYQAKYRTDSETVAGAEALVRWKKPNGEMIPPGRFINLFEKNGFIRRLDLYMLERVCRMLRDRLDKGEALVPVSVNFSRVHIYDPSFPETVYQIMANYGVPPEYIEIELTESAFLTEGNSLNEAVDRLHRLGLSVAIDDFGSGYSSLNMLKDVPVDVLKIDMRFLEGFEKGGKVGTVVTSVVRMAKWLGVPVVAEGVETKEQVDFLRSLGCDLIQGFYYARPIAREAFEELLNKDDARPVVKAAAAAVTLEDINAALGGDSLVTALMDGIVGGFGLYELFGNRLEAIRVNKGYYELMGYPDITSFSSASFNVIDQVYAADQQEVLKTCWLAAETKSIQSFSMRRYSYSGRLLCFRGLIKYIGGSDENPLLCITFIDATESLKAERERELNKYSDALYGIYDEIYEFNFETNVFRLLSSNRVRRSEKSIPLDKAEKKWFGKMVYPEDRMMIEGITEELRRGTIKLPFTEEFRIVTPNGVRWVSSSVVGVSEGSHLLCSLDITEKKQVEAFVDSMEGLHRRMELDMTTGVLSSETSESFIKERLRLDDTNTNSAIMLFSVKDFAGISDKLGNVTANAFLKECAQRIKGSFKEQDVVGRCGEDRFVVLMSGIATSSIAITKAIKAQTAVNEINLPDGLKVDCRVGISLVLPGQRDFDEALEKARAALRQAEENTINRCVIFEEPKA